MNKLACILLCCTITMVSCGVQHVLKPSDTSVEVPTETIIEETVETETEVETDIFTEPVTEEVETEPETEEVETSDALTNNMSGVIMKPVVEEETVTAETITEPVTEEITEPVTEPIIEQPVDTKVYIDKDDILSLGACIIYQEMGGDYGCDDCRRRVLDVVLNRVANPRFPNTIYDVLTQGKMQYGFDKTTGVYWQERAKYPGEAHAVERAYRIAEEVLNGKHSDIYGKDYIWQAEFIQGINNVYCCNTYFGQLDKSKGW